MLTWSVLGPLCVVGLECHLHKAVDRGEIRRGVGSWLVFFLLVLSGGWTDSHTDAETPLKINACDRCGLVTKSGGDRARQSSGKTVVWSLPLPFSWLAESRHQLPQTTRVQTPSSSDSLSTTFPFTSSQPQELRSTLG